MKTRTHNYLLSPWGWLAIGLALMLSIAGCATRKAADTVSIDDITGYPVFTIPRSGNTLQLPTDLSNEVTAISSIRVENDTCTSTLAVNIPPDERSRLCDMNSKRAAVGLPPLDRLPSFSR